MTANQDPFAILARLQRAEKQVGPKFFEDFERERDSKKEQSSGVQNKGTMIYALTVKCVGGPEPIEPSSQVVEMEDDSTLLDLHGVVQRAFQLDPDHLFEFFVGRHPRNRSLLFTDSDDWEASEEVFDSLQLKRIWPLPNKMKLFYWYDFGDDWMFQITKGRSVKRPEEGVSYPRIV